MSLVALAAAMVLATKELILFAGVVRHFGWVGAYGVGDRIQIAGPPRRVVLTMICSPRVIGDRPGAVRSSVHRARNRVSNSLLFTNPLIKETRTGYGLYTVLVPIKNDEDWQRSSACSWRRQKIECAVHGGSRPAHTKLLEQANLL